MLRTKKTAYLFSFLLILFLFNISNSLAIDVPLIPASYYGTITIDNMPGDNVAVFSCIENNETGSVLAYDGTYGIEDNLRLSAEGVSSDEGKTVYFCVGTIRSDQDSLWVSSSINNLNLTFSSNNSGTCVCKENQDDNTVNNNNDDGGGSNGGSNSNNPSITDDGELEQNLTDSEFIEETPDKIVEESNKDLVEQIEGKKDQPSTFQFENSEISDIEIVFNEDTEAPVLTITTYNNQPENVTSLSKNKVVYKYLSIEKNFNSSKIKNAKINFKVETTWMSENEFNPEDIVLFHFKENKWVELPTKLTGLGENAYKFEAETDSFSFFAIATKKRVNITTYIIIIIVIIILVVMLSALFKKGKKVKNNNIIKN